MISGHADVGGTTFDHLQDSVQYADDSAERLVLAVVESALAIEMAKQLVGAIYQVDNHEGLAAVEAGRSDRMHHCAGPPPFLDRVSVGIDHRQVTGARE